VPVRAIQLLRLLAAPTLALLVGLPGTAQVGRGFGAEEAAAAKAALERLPEAVRLFRAGSYDEAAEIFAGLLARLPELREAPAAAALLELGQPDDYRRLLSGLHANLGVCHLRARRYEPARASFEAAVETDPRAAGPRASFGVVLLRMQRYAEAREHLAAAVALGAPGEKVHLDLGEALLRAGEPAEARRALVRAVGLARARGDVQGWGTALEAERLLAEVDLEEGSAADAEARLRRLLALAPGEPKARFRLAQVLLRAGRRDEAREHLDRFERDSRTMASIQSALAASPGRVAALHWVAGSYLELGLLHLAEVHYLQLLARDPADREARRALALLRSRAGESGSGSRPGETP
jgi:tetratricopeptide (TPR) repeat protein